MIDNESPSRSNSSVPSARQGHKVALLDHLLLLWGGEDEGGIRNDLWIFDTVERMYSTKFLLKSALADLKSADTWYRIMPEGDTPGAR